MPEAQDKVDGGVGLNSPHRVYHGADEVGEIERINAADITQEDFEKKYINRSGISSLHISLLAAS
eukprot:318712-Rhodomonas_salina.3